MAAEQLTTERSVSEELGAVSNVLLLCPAMREGEEALCMDLLTVDPPARENVLSVGVALSLDEWTAAWDAHVGDPPAALRAVRAGEGGGADFPGEVSTVDDPADLTGIGVTMTKALKGWAGSDPRTVCCFHSLTALLQYVDLQRAFRFLHVLTGRMSAIDAVAHYHLDPTACDDRTLATLTTLFDAVVEVDEDGPTVRTDDRP